MKQRRFEVGHSERTSDGKNLVVVLRFRLSIYHSGLTEEFWQVLLELINKTSDFSKATRHQEPGHSPEIHFLVNISQNFKSRIQELAGQAKEVVEGLFREMLERSA